MIIMFNFHLFRQKHRTFFLSVLQILNEVRNYLPINTEKLLFGNDSLTDQENSSIFIAVQIYIKNTRRFAAVNQYESYEI